MKSEKKEEKKTFSALLREWIRDIVKVGILFLLLYLYVFQISTVDGSSMKPTFDTGDVVIVDKLSFNLFGVEPLDVVVLKYPDDPHKDFIKRIIGMPGDTVEIRDGVVYITRGGTVERLEDHFIENRFCRDFGPEQVKPYHYFVLGDNRPSSTDSRVFGSVPQDYIKGKVRFRIWPFKRAKFFINPRKQ